MIVGTVKTMANRKLEVVRRRLQREIERLGTDITVHRQKYISDGSNGYIASGEETFGVKGILKSLSGASASTFTYMDGGRNCTITETLSVLYDGKVNFKMYDTFVNGDTKYTVMQASNVGEQNVYWLLGLTTEPVEVPKYDE